MDDAKRNPDADKQAFETARYAAFVLEQSAQLAEVERANPKPAEPMQPDGEGPGTAEATIPESPDEAHDTDEPVKRKVGRPKGSPKVPGSGRQKPKPLTSNELRGLLSTIDGVAFLKKVIEGELIQQSGPTGKTISVIPSVGERLRAVEMLMKKLIPDLAQTQLTGEAGGPIKTEALPSPREAARAILDLLGPGVRIDAGVAVSRRPDLIDGNQFVNGGLANAGSPAGVSAAPADAAVGTSTTAAPSSLQIGAAAADSAPRREAGDLWPSAGSSSTAVVSLAQRRQQQATEQPPEGMRGQNPPDGSGMIAGERILPDNCGGGWLEYSGVHNGDGRSRFWIVDSKGMRHASVLGLQEATEKLQELARTGKVSR